MRRVERLASEAAQKHAVLRARAEALLPRWNAQMARLAGVLVDRAALPMDFAVPGDELHGDLSCSLRIGPPDAPDDPRYTDPGCARIPMRGLRLRVDAEQGLILRGDSCVEVSLIDDALLPLLDGAEYETTRLSLAARCVRALAYLAEDVELPGQG